MKGYFLIFAIFFCCTGNVFGQVNGDYRSAVATGNWNNVASWERYDGSDWISPAPFAPSGSETITIQSGHNITVNAVITLTGSIIVNPGGILTIGNQGANSIQDFIVASSGSLVNNGTLAASGAGSTNNVRVTIDGTLTNNGTQSITSTSNCVLTINGIFNNSVNFSSNTTRLVFQNGSVYNHSFTTQSGNIPTASWQNGSTCRISSYTTNSTAPGGLGQSFYNFEWDTPNLTNDINLNGLMFNVNGNLSLTVPPNVTIDLSEDSGFLLEVGGSFTVSGAGTVNFSGTLDLSGDFVNNGQLNLVEGSAILFNGTSAQNISGSSTIAAYDIIVFNSEGVFVNGIVDLYGILFLDESAAFDADGDGSGILTVKSTGLATGGRIAALLTPQNFSGNVTIERFINGPGDWRYLAMPISNGNVGIWHDAFPVTGNFSNRSPVGNGVTTPTAASIYYFDAPTQNWVAVGSGLSTDATSVDGTRGYSIYTYTNANTVVSARGTMYKGDVPISLSSEGDGWNLVANPMPSPIDWDNVTIPSGLNDAIYLRTAHEQFASYVGGIGVNEPFDGWSGEISIGQSFWVQSESATALTIGEDAKTDGVYEFIRKKMPEDYFRITLSSPSQRDETVVRFSDNATKEKDASLDAVKRKNGCETCAFSGHLNISTFLSDPQNDFAINAIPKNPCYESVGLKVEDVNPGEYTLTFSDMDKLQSGYSVVLIDNYAGEKVTVQQGAEYRFMVTSDAQSAGAGRFVLEFNSLEAAPSTPVVMKGERCGAGSVVMEVSGATENGYYNWYEDVDSQVPVHTSDSPLFTTHELIKSKTWYVSASNAFGCESERVEANAIILFPPSMPEVALKGNILVSSSDSGNQWFKDGALLSGATAPVLHVTESGEYSVKVTSDEGCEVFSENVTFRIMGETGDPDGDGIKAYPNPVTDCVYITLPQNLAQSVREIVLLDAKGTQLEKVHDYSISGDGTLKLDFSGTAAGIFFLKIAGNLEMVTVRVVKY